MFMSLDTTVIAAVTRSITDQGFGFVRVLETNQDIFVRQEKLLAAGFKIRDFAMGVRVALEVEGVPRGLRAARILKIGDQKSPRYYIRDQIVDQHDPYRIVKTGRVDNPVYRIEIKLEKGGWSFVADKLLLGEARKYIGKPDAPKVAAGQKTNVGGEGHVKGSRGDGGGRNHGQNKAKEGKNKKK